MSVLKKPIINLVSFYFFLFSFSGNLLAQKQDLSHEINLLFYNTENLFDFQDNPLTQDDEFLPWGERHWTKKRFDDKLNKIAKVILASCGFEVPVLVGLCEIENRWVLEELIGKSPLSKFNFQIIHKDSPDERGIDIALLYRKELISPIEYEYIPISDNEGKTLSTREILHASFLISNADTLHVFYNHWPSRYSGQAETEPLRIRVAQTLGKAINQLLEATRMPKIVLMGDFNDQPSNKSLKDVLGAMDEEKVDRDGELVNLSVPWDPKGTIKHQQSWQIFDQIIVTDYLLRNSGLHTTQDGATIVNLPFLFEPDPKFKGKRLFRTYSGYKYHGGFSDHLPVRLKLLLND